MKGDVRRRKLMSPMLLAPSLELPFFDRAVEDEACDTVYQRGNDSHLRNNRRTAKGSDRGVAKNGNIFFERAVGSLGSRSQGVQFTIPFSASGDFQNKARMLGNRDMRMHSQVDWLDEDSSGKARDWMEDWTSHIA